MTPLPPRRNQPPILEETVREDANRPTLELRQQQIIYSSFVTSVAPFTHKMAKISVSPCAAISVKGCGQV